MTPHARRPRIPSVTRRTLGRLLLASSGALVACAVDTADFARPRLDAALHAAVGQHLRPDDESGALPPGVALEDGVDGDEATAIALWNNPDFAVALADLGVRRRQLAESGLLQNPFLSLLFPIGPKQLEFTVQWPMLSVLQRPARIAAARADCERAAALLLRAGLDLIRDVRNAGIERDRAARRAELAEQALAVAGSLERIATARLRAGDVSELEALAATIATLEARRERDDRRAALATATERVWALLGLAPAGEPRLLPLADPPATTASADELLALALAARPDVRAAEFELEAAGERVGLAHDQWSQLQLLIDANGQGKDGFEIGPGLWIDLPIFHRGSRISSAEAEVLLALERYAAVRQRVAAEVTAARLDTQQAEVRVHHLEAAIRPARATALERARSLAAAGQEPETTALLAEQALVQLDMDRCEAAAALARARTALERAVGCRLPLHPDHPEETP